MEEVIDFKNSKEHPNEYHNIYCALSKVENNLIVALQISKCELVNSRNMQKYVFCGISS